MLLSKYKDIFVNNDKLCYMVKNRGKVKVTFINDKDYIELNDPTLCINNNTLQSKCEIHFIYDKDNIKTYKKDRYRLVTDKIIYDSHTSSTIHVYEDDKRSYRISNSNACYKVIDYEDPVIMSDSLLVIGNICWYKFKLIGRSKIIHYNKHDSIKALVFRNGTVMIVIDNRKTCIIPSYIDETENIDVFSYIMDNKTLYILLYNKQSFIHIAMYINIHDLFVEVYKYRIDSPYKICLYNDRLLWVNKDNKIFSTSFSNFVNKSDLVSSKFVVQYPIISYSSSNMASIIENPVDLIDVLND